MNLNFLPELLSLIPLTWILVVLWRERTQFRWSKIFLVAVILIFVARLSDVILEYSASRLYDAAARPRETSMILIDVIGDIGDPTGILLLVIGFVGSIKFQHAEEEKIRTLESLLPLCAQCKKYRTNESRWLPIEDLLIKRGVSRITQGICPECTKRMLEEAKRLRARRMDKIS